MNWLKNLLTPILERTKADVLREIDRAIGKIDSGDSPKVIAEQLRNTLTRLLATAKLPPAGAVLLTIALASMDWPGLIAKPSADIRAELVRLREKIKGVRL